MSTLSNKKAEEILLAEWRDTGARFAEKIERNPWVHEYRRVKAEVERTGDDNLFVDFQRRFKQAEALRHQH